MNKKIDINYFPGWVRKSVTFSIDDGYLSFDKRFLDILKPVGFLGTFNLCSDRATFEDKDYARSLYCGYEIGNHTKYHPYCMKDGVDYKFSDLPFDENTADTGLVYKTDTEGLYWVWIPDGWRIHATAEFYLECIKNCHRELEEVFGVGSVRSFAWPQGEQSCKVAKDYLKQIGYYGVRDAGRVAAQDSKYDMPTDRMSWFCSINACNLLPSMREYESLADDGRLKFFAFGVHSFDFERYKKWDDLTAFAKEFGNREGEFYYATVGDIFSYESAIKNATVTGDSVTNNSELTLYFTAGGEKKTLLPHQTIIFQ